jgi:hypothetical protein
MMGNQSGTQLPDNPLDDVKGEARFWVTGPIAGEKLLRPDFGAAWGKNSHWHKSLWKEIEKRGSTLVPACTQVTIRNIGEVVMLKLAGRTTFKHLKERYINERKSTRELAHDKKEKTIQARKTKVSSPRLLYCNETLTGSHLY